MQRTQSRREECHDIICEEFLQERAAVLGRAGMAVEDVLSELAKLDQEIQIKKEQLQYWKLQEQSLLNLNEPQVLVSEINVSIDQFNAIRKKLN